MHSILKKNQELIQQVKQINGARWSQQKKTVAHTDTIENRISLNCNNTLEQLSLGHTLFRKFKQWLQSNAIARHHSHVL
jgi:hypothetical protein